jgi:hypothetical protein
MLIHDTEQISGEIESNMSRKIAIAYVLQIKYVLVKYGIARPAK